MKEFDFALILADVNELSTKLADAFFDAGCDDATLCLRHGVVYVGFNRQAASLREAIFAAIKSVHSAGYQVLRVDDADLVTQSEIARRIDRSRQLVHQYITGKRGVGGFPPPECHLGDDAAPLWSWCAVSRWFAEQDIIRPEVYHNAEVIKAINTKLESNRQRKQNPSLAAEVAKVFAESS